MRTHKFLGARKSAVRCTVMASIVIAVVFACTLSVNAIIPGDVNGDGKVNIRDAATILLYLDGKEVEVFDRTLDANGDGKITVEDATALLLNITGHDVDLVVKPCEHKDIVITPGVKPSCSTYGYTEKKHCAICGEILSEHKKIDKINHTFNNGKCDYCNVEFYSEGLEYILSNDNQSYIVSGIGEYTGELLIIPDTYNDLPVVQIKSEAFIDCNWIAKIIVPDSVIKIGEGAFKGCNNLVEITLPFIGRQATDSNNNVLGYIFGYKNISNSDNTKTSANKGYTQQYSSYGYYIPSSLRKVIVTSDITIPNYAFQNCDLIETIDLPDNVVSLGSYAFQNCTALKSIDGDKDGVLEVSSDITNWGEFTFSGCLGINKLVVSSSLIGSYAFKGCTELTEVVFNADNTIIKNYAFENCNFTKFIITENVIQIGEGVLKGCDKLVDLTLPFIGYKEDDNSSNSATFG